MLPWEPAWFPPRARASARTPSTPPAPGRQGSRRRPQWQRTWSAALLLLLLLLGRTPGPSPTRTLPPLLQKPEMGAQGPLPLTHRSGMDAGRAESWVPGSGEARDSRRVPEAGVSQDGRAGQEPREPGNRPASPRLPGPPRSRPAAGAARSTSARAGNPKLPGPETLQLGLAPRQVLEDDAGVRHPREGGRLSPRVVQPPRPLRAWPKRGG